MSDKTVRLPEVMVFAGPNGSGKTTITKMAHIVGDYINADDIKKTILCTDMEAAIKAEELREEMIRNKKDFTFETVLSTERNINLLRNAKEQLSYFEGKRYTIHIGIAFYLYLSHTNSRDKYIEKQ